MLPKGDPSNGKEPLKSDRSSHNRHPYIIITARGGRGERGRGSIFRKDNPHTLTCTWSARLT